MNTDLKKIILKITWGISSSAFLAVLVIFINVFYLPFYDEEFLTFLDILENGLPGLVDNNELKCYRKPIFDKALEQRLSPECAGIDKNGYRNKSTLNKADIVAIGDSVTFGYNASSDKTWPAELSTLSGQSVYNMSVMGYGPVHYLMLMDEAVTLSPKTIVVGLFAGNNIITAYRLAYSNDLYKYLRKNEYMDGGKNYFEDFSKRFNDVVKKRDDFFKLYEKTHVVEWLKRNLNPLRLFFIVDRFKSSSFYRGKSWALANNDDAAFYDDHKLRTVFQTKSRLMSMDTDNELVVRDGLRITKAAMKLMTEKAQKHNIKLMFILIPTKELVYANLCKVDKMQDSDTYFRLVKMETVINDDILAFCKQNGIQCVNSLTKLRESLSKGNKIYPDNVDSHPSEGGYKNIAETLLPYVR
ncbi:hypothetical protein [Candidatus Magnetomonas plexicatena]|uniref:hypothetical protein n=1 Tax=Candidatus Magnetomonas plexicatena TaxID=2552947 RepID=UPI001C770176|nr:hypothetical protein E2O03_004110 [Nitrospirales bacterium LBB_01]